MKIVGDCEVVVVGGGPAGSTAAAILAGQGRKVLVLEKEKFPRYHIGESLLPFCYFPLERIGVIEKMKASRFPRKYAVQFVSTSGKVSAPFYFFQHLDHEAAATWQVVRSEFDRMLLENAREKGAEVMEETAARELILEDEAIRGVVAQPRGGEPFAARAPMTIDASGRQALSISHFGWQKWDPRLNKVAIWTYFRGARRDPGLDEGSTTVAYLPGKGWFWYIPLPDDVVSVGIVAEKEYLFGETNDLPEIFCREIGNNPWIADHLSSGRQFGKYHATKEFSYRSQHCAADGLVLAGDAFAFLDPVFSSGVYLALRSGELAADAVDEALESGDLSAARFQPYSDRIRGEIEPMRKLVYAFYDTAFSFGEVIAKHPQMRGDLTDCLIGNLNRDFSGLFDAIGEHIDLPAPLPHGAPRLAARPDQKAQVR
ncbi:MAG: tryptophan 7-halogenase [Planctomycetes bacterium]|nr:tryptophan 7-halogenase [Planctomycetota bacterium]